MGRELLFLYKTAPGRLLLQFLTWRPFSVSVGKFLDSPLSIPLIHLFVKKNHIELKECEQTDFHSFNDCFTRKLKPEKRPVDRRASSLVAPCDGLLSVWEIRQTTVLPICYRTRRWRRSLKGEPVWFTGCVCSITTDISIWTTGGKKTISLSPVFCIPYAPSPCGRSLFLRKTVASILSCTRHILEKLFRWKWGRCWLEKFVIIIGGILFPEERKKDASFMVARPLLFFCKKTG